MKIYDCFIFYNELDLLEMRLKILEKTVDYFVIVEAKKTHSGKTKPLNYEANKNRFKKWHPKIIYIVAEDLPLPTKFSFGKNWRLNSIFGIGGFKPEIAQRKHIQHGLKNAKSEDIIIVSDLDEIPNPKKFDLMKKLLKNKSNKVITFDQRMFYYFLNGLKAEHWPGTKACTYRTFKRNFKSHSENLRRLRSIKVRILMKFNKGVRTIVKGGWHFSYLGSPDKISEKIKNLSHREHDKKEFTDEKAIQDRVKKGEDLFGRSQGIKYIQIDESFPEEIQKNKKKYSKIIKKI